MYSDEKIDTTERAPIYLDILDSCLKELEILECKISFIRVRQPEECVDGNTITNKTLLEEKLLSLLNRINNIKDSIKV